MENHKREPAKEIRSEDYIILDDTDMDSDANDDSDDDYIDEAGADIMNPPVFSSSTEPIVVNDWLCKIGRELTTAGGTNAERVRFAAHQLDGPIACWWENFTATYPIDTVTWDRFQQAFRATHVSAGAMSMKKREFHNLHQGGHTVGQYLDEFSKLAHYAPDDVATDTAKQENILEGLNDELSMQLSWRPSTTTRIW